MSTDTKPETQEPSGIDQVITEEIAKQWGLDWNPDKPKTFRDVINSQMASSLNLIKQQSAASNAQISKAREKILDRVTKSSKATPEVQQQIAYISKGLEAFPQFIGAIKIYLATAIRWQTENDRLLGTFVQDNPMHMLDMLGKFQEVLRESVPYAQWPENVGKTPEQIAAELAAREAAKATG